VASYMELDFNDSDTAGANPAFFYHLGDVVYYDGEIKNYYWEFYEPYLHYPGPIFAIPGNHDGDVDPNDEFHTPADSLKGFVRNFCSQAAIHLPEADDAPRDAMTQPNVYWTLNTPLATIIGLYTNVPAGGRIGLNQLAWFKQELTAAPKDRALILALHHPIYSAYGNHPGSQILKDLLEEATAAAGRIPNLILTGHVHDYQRFTGYINNQPVTTLVVGAGGYNQKLHRLDRRQFDPNGGSYKFQDGPEVLEKFNDFQHGYLIVDVRKDKILGSYIAVDDPTAEEPVPTKVPKAYDEFEIGL
jgi:acid phosphatase type 7